MENENEPIPVEPTLDPEEARRLQNWRELQMALGLDPDAMAPPPTPAAPAPAPAPMPKPTRRTHVEPEPDAAPAAFGAGLLDDIEMPAGSGEGLTALGAVGDPPLSALDEGNGEVEVGEAPEEVPEEPGEDAADKKRRRRRRRRPRRGEEAGAPAVNGAVSDERLAPGEAEAEAEEEDELEDEDEEIEPLQIPDWNVPTWQELIDGLYRPER